MARSASAARTTASPGTPRSRPAASWSATRWFSSSRSPRSRASDHSVRSQTPSPHRLSQGPDMTTPTLTPRVDVRRADERSATRISWLDSKHSFSFGSHYDPATTHHGTTTRDHLNTHRRVMSTVSDQGGSCLLSLPVRRRGQPHPGLDHLLEG